MTHEMIERFAYLLYLTRLVDGSEGDALSDWYNAEAMLRKGYDG